MVKQLFFGFVQEKRSADNKGLDDAYNELSGFYGNELVVLDRLTPYCQLYLDRVFRQRNTDKYSEILCILANNGAPLGLSNISSYSFQDRNSTVTRLRQMCEKGVLTKNGTKYSLSSEPFLKWMVFRQPYFLRALDFDSCLADSLTPVSDFIRRKSTS